MSDQNKRPDGTGDPEISDIVKSILDEPMHQPRYSMKHYISGDSSSNDFREAAQNTVNTAWKKLNPLAKAPVLHDPLNPEDEWNIRRSTAFLALGVDIGDYPPMSSSRAMSLYDICRYRLMVQMFDANVGRKPTIASMEKDDRDMLLYGLHQASKTPDGFGGEPQCFMQSNGETR